MDKVQQIEHQDGIGRDYQELVTMATRGYWVAPINTDSVVFYRYYHATNWAENGQVHYARRVARSEWPRCADDGRPMKEKLR